MCACSLYLCAALASCVLCVLCLATCHFTVDPIPLLLILVTVLPCLCAYVCPAAPLCSTVSQSLAWQPFGAGAYFNKSLLAAQFPLSQPFCSLGLPFTNYSPWVGWRVAVPYPKRSAAFVSTGPRPSCASSCCGCSCSGGSQKVREQKLIVWIFKGILRDF